ncbi:diphthine--ammonia ligase [soil metagenome]
MKKSFLNWSSGKDAAMALMILLQEKEYSVEKLVTTVNKEIQRISMHGVREKLLKIQSQCIGRQLHIIPLEGNIPLEEYNRCIQKHVGILKAEGFTHSVFGDIFLEDLREYRTKQLEHIGIKAVFPLWKKDTTTLIREFIETGFKAITVCVNSKMLDPSFCGRIIDQNFIASLPDGVDPCGENGEFHTFVFDGPIFKFPVKFEIGEVVEKFYKPNKDEDDCFKDKKETWDTSFWYCDLIPDQK